MDASSVRRLENNAGYRMGVGAIITPKTHEGEIFGDINPLAKAKVLEALSDDTGVGGAIVLSSEVLNTVFGGNHFLAQEVFEGFLDVVRAARDNMGKIAGLQGAGFAPRAATDVIMHQLALARKRMEEPQLVEWNSNDEMVEPQIER